MLSVAGNKKGFLKWFRYSVVVKRFNSPLGWSILILLALAFALTSANKLFIINFLVIAGIGGTIVAAICILQPLTGFYLTVLFSCFAFYPQRLGITVPVNTGIEVLILLNFIGAYFKRSKDPLNEYVSFIRTPVSIGFILYTAFFLVEIFNPNMYSAEGWLFFMRRWLGFILIYVTAYKLLNSFDRIREFIKTFIILAFIIAIYGCLQTWFGLLPFEMNWLKSNPHEYRLFLTGGYMRVFSFLSDPAAFGILSGSMAMLTLVFAISSTRRKHKLILFIAAAFMLMGMSYSGTRTANIIPVAAIALYVLMTITHKRTMMVLFSTIVAGMFLLYGPIDNPTVNRMRSTFRSEDASLNTRDVNRHFIQPYIYKHPLGGGIATSAREGLDFNPGHPLAGFPPDSGLLKAAIETGWIGYAFMIIFFFLVLYQGVHYYYLVEDPVFKQYLLAITIVELSYIITQYAQISIGEIPSTFLFYPILAIMPRLLQLDKAKKYSQEIKTA